MKFDSKLEQGAASMDLSQIFLLHTCVSPSLSLVKKTLTAIRAVLWDTST